MAIRTIKRNIYYASKLLKVSFIIAIDNLIIKEFLVFK